MIKKLPDGNSPLNELAKFADVNFIVTDLDGTLIEQGDKVIGQLLKVGKAGRLFRNRTYITIATGRTYHGAKAIIEQLQLKKGMPIVLYNGAIVISYQTNEILYRKTINFAVIKELCRIIDLKNSSLLAYCFVMNQEVFNDEINEVVIETVHGYGSKKAQKDINQLDIYWHSSFREEINPNAILISKESLGDGMQELIEYLENSNEVSYTDSGNGFFEIRSKGVDKGIIFKVLEERRFFKVKKSLAIGDNDNDMELLQQADIGVVVSNGSEKAIQAADYMCKNAGASGVLDVMAVIKSAQIYCGEGYQG